eukprot:3184445-Karenia_brevis.AAC.1
MESSDDEDMGVGPSIKELEQMKVVSKRRKRFEKDKKESGVRLRIMYEKRHACGGCGVSCEEE